MKKIFGLICILCAAAVWVASYFISNCQTEACTFSPFYFVTGMIFAAVGLGFIIGKDKKKL